MAGLLRNAVEEAGDRLPRIWNRVCLAFVSAKAGGSSAYLSAGGAQMKVLRISNQIRLGFAEEAQNRKTVVRAGRVL